MAQVIVVVLAGWAVVLVAVVLVVLAGRAEILAGWVGSISAEGRSLHNLCQARTYAKERHRRHRHKYYRLELGNRCHTLCTHACHCGTAAAKARAQVVMVVTAEAVVMGQAA